jgi:hypothetical protein
MSQNVAIDAWPLHELENTGRKRSAKRRDEDRLRAREGQVQSRPPVNETGLLSERERRFVAAYMGE